jgi:hypothetical protein
MKGECTMANVLEMRLDGVKIPHTADVKIEKTGTEKGDPSYRIDMKVDFTGWTVSQILDLAIRQLVISRQRVWRKMSVEDVKKESGKTFLASDMGKAPKAQVDVQAVYTAGFANMSPEEQQAELERLMALMAQGKQG